MCVVKYQQQGRAKEEAVKAIWWILKEKVELKNFLDEKSIRGANWFEVNWRKRSEIHTINDWPREAGSFFKRIQINQMIQKQLKRNKVFSYRERLCRRGLGLSPLFMRFIKTAKLSWFAQQDYCPRSINLFIKYLKENRCCWKYLQFLNHPYGLVHIKMRF